MAFTNVVTLTVHPVPGSGATTEQDLQHYRRLGFQWLATQMKTRWEAHSCHIRWKQIWL